MKKDDPITSFCKATSGCRNAGLYYLEGFNWNLDDAVSGFLRDELPPLKNPSPPSSQPSRTVKDQRSRSRPPSRRRYSTTSVSESTYKMDQDEISIMRSPNTAFATRCLDDISHGVKIVPLSDPVSVNHELDKRGIISRPSYKDL